MNLNQACRKGDIKGVKELLEQGVDPSDDNNFAIQEASWYGHADVVSLLLQDSRVDPTYYGNWALRMACKYGYINVVKVLLQDQRVDPADYDNDAIKLACRFGLIEVVEALLQDGRVDPTIDNEWAINHAKTPEIREMLIAYKYRVDGPEYQKLKNNLLG
jgi:ankyrin repeat protein